MRILNMVALAGFMLALVMLACAPRGPAPATKEPYKVGYTGAFTGPGAAGQLEGKEGFRIYIQALNDRGGIDGHPIEVIYEDDRAEGARAVSNVKKFEGVGVNLVVLDSLSGVYAGVLGEGTRINIPVLSFSVAIREAGPPTPHRLAFSVGHVGLAQMPPIADIKMTRDLAGGKPVKLGITVADLPLARLSGEIQVKEAKKAGFETMLEVVPMGVTDLTPIARKFMEAKANFITYYGPGHLLYLLGDALLKLGYKDTFYVQVGGGSFETALVEKWKGVENFVAGTVQAMPPTFNLPEHKPIIDASGKYGIAVPMDHDVVDGWLNGMTLAEVFRKAGWPVNTEKLLGVMNNFKLERAPLGPPIRWTAEDHIGDRWYGYFTWRGGKIVPAVKDNWIGVNTKFEIIGAVSSLKDIKAK